MLKNDIIVIKPEVINKLYEKEEGDLFSICLVLQV